MRTLIIILIIFLLINCKKSNFSGNLGSCKSIYHTTSNSIIINDTLQSPFCLIAGLNYSLDITNLNLTNIKWNTEDSTNIISINEAKIYEGFGISINNDTVNFSFLAQQCNDHVYTPNIFTPNGDNENNFWKPIFTPNTICDEDYKLLIFNQYHQLIFSTNNLNLFWDGSNKGNTFPGIYHYILNYKREDGEVFEKNGQLLLLL